METREAMQAKYEEVRAEEERAEEGWRYLLDSGFDSHFTDEAWEEVLDIRDIREAYGAICEILGDK
jgi:hypothetical protein